MGKTIILFADNDPIFLAERAGGLEKEGYSVIQAESSRKAWEIIRRRRIDLAIVDIRLTNDDDELDETGLQLAKELALRHTPIVILTAFPVDNHIIEILKIVRDVSPLKLDIVGKREGYDAMSLAVARSLAISSFQQAQSQGNHRKGGSKEIFLVYGHDKRAKQDVTAFLSQIGVRTVDISVKASQGRTIIEQIKHHSNVSFAVVLLTPDDITLSNHNKKTRRPRQNVIFELGFFLGVLGDDRVCSLRKGNVEILSDYHGVIYKTMDVNGAWKSKLAQELLAAGIEIDLKKVVEV